MGKIDEMLNSFSTRLDIIEQVSERNDEELNMLVDELYSTVLNCPLDQFGDEQLASVTELSDRIGVLKK